MPLASSLQLAIAPDAAARALTSFLAYAAHACVWGAAAFVTLRVTTLSAATRHWFWRAALLAPLVSVALLLVLPDSVQRALERVPPARAVSIVSRVESSVTHALVLPLRAADAARPIALGLALCALLGLARFALAFWQLTRTLRARSPVHDARVLGRLEQLRRRSQVRSVVLSAHAALRSPLVIGTRELCVPAALLRALSAAELDAVFAHELAHLERCDGVWFPVIGLVQSLLWMQPLNHALAARCRQTAELACDDRAVQLTGDALSLARALARVATGPAFAERSAWLPAMAHTKAALLPRVMRLLAHAPQLKPHESCRVRYLALAGFLTIGMVSSQVSVSLAARPETLHRSEQPAQPVPQAAVAADATTLRTELEALLLRERQIGTQLEIALTRARTRASDVQLAVHITELSQELRHVREAEAWTEARLLNAR